MWSGFIAGPILKAKPLLWWVNLFLQDGPRAASRERKKCHHYGWGNHEGTCTCWVQVLYAAMMRSCSNTTFLDGWQGRNGSMQEVFRNRDITQDSLPSSGKLSLIQQHLENHWFDWSMDKQMSFFWLCSQTNTVSLRVWAVWSHTKACAGSQ